MATLVTLSVWVGVAAISWLALESLISPWMRLSEQNTKPETALAKTSGRKLSTWQQALWIFALLAVPIGCYSYVRSLSARVAEDPFKVERAAEERLVNEWLSEQRKGRDTATTSFWLDESWVTPTKFFAVRSWEIVDSSYGNVTVRVESSNGLHQPIVALWRIHLKQVPEKSGNWKLYSVDDIDKKK